MGKQFKNDQVSDEMLNDDVSTENMSAEDVTVDEMSAENLLADGVFAKEDSDAEEQPAKEEYSSYTAQLVARLNRRMLGSQGSRTGRRDSMKTVGDATWRALHDALNEPQLKDQQGTGDAGFILRRDKANRCVTVTWAPSEEETQHLDDAQYLAAIRQRLDRWRAYFARRSWRQDEIADEGGVPWIRLPLDESTA